LQGERGRDGENTESREASVGRRASGVDKVVEAIGDVQRPWRDVSKYSDGRWRGEARARRKTRGARAEREVEGEREDEEEAGQSGRKCMAGGGESEKKEVKKEIVNTSGTR
jgi:hypothetical protein